MAGSNGTAEVDVESQNRSLYEASWLEQESVKPRMARWEIGLFSWTLTILLLVGIYTTVLSVLDWVKTLRASQ